VTSVTSRVANDVIKYRVAEGKVERLPALAAELVALKVDVIVAAAGTLGVLPAKQATKMIEEYGTI
jgi:putative ABC transport system substrate-binding protein